MRLFSCILLASLAHAQSQRSHSVSNTVIIRQGGSYLGIAFVDIPNGPGIQVKYVESDSPAAKAGLKMDDVVLEFNGQRVENTPQFVRMVSEFTPGRKLKLGIIRAGAPLTLTAILEYKVSLHEGPVPPMPPIPPTVVLPDLPRMNMLWRNQVLGIETEELNSQLAEYFGVKEGVLVRMVTRGSYAERGGLKAGDVIVKAAGKPVGTTREISSQLQNRKSIPLSIVRNHKDLSLDLLLN